MLNIILLALFIALQIADITTTRMILNNGGKELNPVMAFLMHTLGFWPGVILPKLAFTALLAFAAYWQLTAACCIGFIYVVFHNIRWLRTQAP